MILIRLLFTIPIVFSFLGLGNAGLFAQAAKKQLSFRAELLFVDNNEVCSIGDVNRDGLTDIVAGRLWYAAPDFVPRPLRPLPLHPPEYAQNNGEALWDVDGDGWLDLIASGWGETRLQWFKNPGENGLKKGLEWKAHTLVDTKISQSEAGFFKDIDGDGRPEYILNSWNHRVPFSIWYFTKNEDGSPSMRGVAIGDHNSHGVGFGDINGDGRLDILFDEGWYEQPLSNPWVEHWRLHRDWVVEDGSCPFQVLDLTEDGLNDFIWGRGHHYGLYWMEQGPSIGDSTIWTKHLIDDSWSQAHTLTMADLDQDGQLELLTGKRVWAHTGKDPGADDPPVLYRYVWNRNSKVFERHLLAEGNIGTGLFLKAVDLNQDDKLDIVVAGKTGTYILWQE